MLIAGTGVHDSSVRFRMYVIVIFGIFAFGAVMVWRTETLLSADYQGLDFTPKRSSLNRENLKSQSVRLDAKADLTSGKE